MSCSFLAKGALSQAVITSDSITFEISTIKRRQLIIEKKKNVLSPI